MAQSENVTRRVGTRQDEVYAVLHTDEDGNFYNASNPAPIYPVGQDTSLNGEQVTAQWFPEHTATFSVGIPNGVEESVKTAGVTTSFSTKQLAVTVPPGESYTLRFIDTVKYTNGQETRGEATTAFESDPATGHTAILWMLSEDGTSGFGIGHANGDEVFAWRYDNVTTYTNRADWNYDTPVDNIDGTTSPVDLKAPQINRLRMLYLGYGPLVSEVRNLDQEAADKWIPLNSKNFINDSSRLEPNLSDADLSLTLEITNTGSGDCVVRTNSWACGPVIGDIGQQQPDGDRVFPKADGTAFETRTPLLAAATYDSRTDNGITDTDGWSSFDLVINTDQISAGDGIVVNFVRDAQEDPPVVIHRDIATFTAEDVINGSVAFTRVIHGDGLYLTYTNGGTPQGSLDLQLNLRTQATLPQASLESDIEGTSGSVMTRTGLFGESGQGNGYGLIGRGGNGEGLDTHVTGADPRIFRALFTRSKVTAVTLTTTSQQIDATPLASRSAALIIVDPSNNQDVRINLGAAATGSSPRLAARDQLVLPFSEIVSIHGVSVSGSQIVYLIEGGEPL